jgi:hypothetical protein
MIPGKASPLASEMKSTMATAPPELQISLDRSKLCLAIYRMQMAAYFLTRLSLSLSLYNILGKMSLSTTIYARSIVCLDMLARHEQTWRFSWASWWLISWAKNGTAPASTTNCASSGECLHISLKAEAAILFSVGSGSWTQRTSKGTAPTSTTDMASSGVCLAM